MELIIFSSIITVSSVIRTIHISKKYRNDFELSDYILFGGICLWIVLALSYFKDAVIFIAKKIIAPLTFEELKIGDYFILTSMNHERYLTGMGVEEIKQIYVKTEKDSCVPKEYINEKDFFPYKIFTKDIPVYHIYYDAKNNPVIDMPSVFLEFPSIKNKILRKKKINIEKLK